MLQVLIVTGEEKRRMIGLGLDLDLVVLVVIGLILALDLLPVGNWTIALSHLGLALM